MVAFNFKPGFVPLIQVGKKYSTIRGTARCKPGDIMQLYTGMRTKSCKLIMEVMCVDVLPIGINDDAILVPEDVLSGQLLKYGYYLPKIVSMEGFTTIEEMTGFFKKEYGLPYLGYLHVWR